MPLIWGRLLHRPAYRFGRMMIGPKPRRKKENLVDGRGLGTPFSIYCAPGPSVQCEVTSLIFSRKQLFSRNDKQTQQQQTKTIEAVSTAFLSVQRAALLTIATMMVYDGQGCAVPTLLFRSLLSGCRLLTGWSAISIHRRYHYFRICAQRDHREFHVFATVQWNSTVERTPIRFATIVISRYLADGDDVNTWYFRQRRKIPGHHKQSVFQWYR
jgi:hypothetical protein